jgi:hypothetical protein
MKELLFHVDIDIEFDIAYDIRGDMKKCFHHHMSNVG